ncbi:Glutamyl aminopeptidase, partial [Trachymyrmex cornetzi]
FYHLKVIYLSNSKWLAATYFEPYYARRTFPCWDEPALKATFNISVKHHQKYGVLSNMPIREQFLEQDGMMQTHFDITPIMSTYIVAIVMSDFVRVPNANETINMWCKSSLTSKVKFAHSITEKAVEFLIEYTNSSQKVPKMDHFLLPNFTISGMENWGLIIYHELKIIYDDSDPIYRKTEIALIVSHELAHQWFGNLVTPSWWSYLWLSEGLAAFFEMYITNKVTQLLLILNYDLWSAMQSALDESDVPHKDYRIKEVMDTWMNQGRYYRVSYDSKNYQKISHYLNSKEYKNIHVLNRAQIMIDLLAMVFADRINGNLFVDLISYLSKEREYAPWLPLFQMIESISPNILLLQEFYHIKVRLVQLLERLLHYVGYIDNPNDDAVTKLTRLSVLKWACTLGHEECKKITALKLNIYFRILYEDQSMYYCTGMMAANMTTWNKMLELYLKNKKFEKHILEYLNCAEDPDIIINYLNIISLDTSLFHNEHSLVFNDVLKKHARNDKIRDYVLKNFGIIKPRWRSRRYEGYLQFFKWIYMIFFLHNMIALIILHIKVLSKWLAVTHFEPNGAKRMFPCWDEPALKATFNISVLHHRKYSVLSNMPIQKKFLEQKDMIRTNFKTTPIMSTYIVAIVMSNLVKVPNAKDNINIWCKSLTSKVTLAHNITKKVVKYLIKYTNSSQKVPKMDYVLIPEFVVDGMENWGLITYDESKIIYDNSSDPTYRTTEIALTIAHKLAHQWFGNLVTPSWWPYLWLSKGLASFFQTYIIDKIFKNYRHTTKLFMIQRIQQCLLQDTGSLNFVTMKFGSTFEDNSLNPLVYKKASVLLRMLQNTITNEVFRMGLITYLTKHQFSSATPDDLWSAMQSALDESYVPHEDYRIKEVMDTWMNQERYPFVHVERNYETGEVTISQTYVRHYGETKNKIKWWIPITFTTQSNPDFSNTVPRYWLRPDQHNISFTINPDDWIIVNLQLTGYYRVSYDIKNWQKITRYLNSNNYTKIHVLNRAQIIVDAFILMLDDRMNGYSFVQLITYLSKDRNHVAWQSLFEIIKHMPKVLLLPEVIYVKMHFEHLLNSLLQNIKYEETPNDDDITKLTRINALKCACYLGNEECKRVTALKLSKHLEDPETYKIPQEEKFVYCAGMMAANRTTWDKMFELYLIKKGIKWERMKLLKGLSCAEDPDIIINYLNISALNTSLFHNNAHSFIFKYILENHARNDIILEYILKNFMIMLPRSFTAHAVIKLILDNVHSYEQIEKVNFIILNSWTIPCIGLKNLKIIDRLPKNTIPIQYNIHLTTYLREGNYTFFGKSNINIKIHYASSKISLHSRELEIIETTTLINDNGTIYKPMKHTHNNVTDILTLDFNDVLSPGLYILNMEFVGYLSEPSEELGFMKFSYIDKTGQNKWLAATHFEPNGARQMFPCWDEPALKATFNISVKHHQKYGVLSNMPIREQFLEQDSMMQTHFDITPIMSTYIVAIVMSDFVRVPNANETINMWCKSSLTSKVKFAHSIAEKVVEFLIQYTNIFQKVPKMDHVLIPTFTVYGMENWGLIIYRESNVISDDKSDPIYKKAQALLISHELAHQWFGNLVTPVWWNYLWLSEGLAAFFETITSKHFFLQIFKDWRAMDLFVIEKMHYCLIEDTGSWNSVTLKLGNTFDEQLSIFSNEVYKKAPVLLRMLHNTITAEVFRKGLVTYLSKHQFSTATPDDLWSAMQSALDESNIPHEDYTIKEVMDTWMNQERYPFVHVERNYETGEVTISQICVRKDNETENKTTKWWIPITFATQSNLNFSNTVPRYWLRPDRHNISFTINPNDWIIVNLQQTGYYRVSYDITNWKRILHYLNSKKYTNVHVLNRAQIITDSFAMVLDNRMNGYFFIQLINYLFQDTDYVAWQPLFQIIETMTKTLLLPEIKLFKVSYKQQLKLYKV